MAVSETADRKNGRSPGAGHDEWWERLMMEPGSGESAGTDAEPVIPSGAVAEEVSGEAGRKDTPPEPEDPVRRRTSGRQRRASLEEYRETYLTVPKIRKRKTVFVSEDVRDELDAIVRRLGGRGMSVSGLLENLAREHLAAYREDIEQWRKTLTACYLLRFREHIQPDKPLQRSSTARLSAPQTYALTPSPVSASHCTVTSFSRTDT